MTVKEIKQIMINKGVLNFLSDEDFLKVIFKFRMGKEIDLNNPQTFSEKLQWLKLNDRKDIYTTMVDKYEAKKYVSNIIGEKYIIPTLGIWNEFEDIDFDKLPNQFVLKCTHDSGGIVICKDKSTFNIQEAKKKLKKRLKRNYYYTTREWPYKNVKPRIIAEKYMEDKINKDLIDYKFMCFNGKVKCSFVCLNRYSKEGLNVDFYDLDWKKMPFERHYRNSNITLEKPKEYELMIDLAEKLAVDIPFVRVDFYEINECVYFGELTFFPGAGLEEFRPEKYDKIIGDMLTLPKIGKEEKNEK